jgi:hypothetical protein
MTFPQPNADGYATGGSGFFRLNTRLSSPGDMYESAQGAHNFAIGPDSDISKVNVAYFDDQVPTFMNQFSLGPARSFAGFVAARNEALYAPISRPGRTLIWSDDLFNSQFRPPGFDPDTDTFNIIVPQLDVIQFFSDPPGILPDRNDKSYLIQNVAADAIDARPTYFMIPFYGRRYGMVEITNRSAFPFSWGIFGVNFAISPIGPGALDQITAIRALAPIAATVNEVTKITSFVHGVFDYLLLEIVSIANKATFPAPIKVVCSDVAQD